MVENLPPKLTNVEMEERDTLTQPSTWWPCQFPPNFPTRTAMIRWLRNIPQRSSRRLPKRPMAHTLVDTPTSCVHIENTRHDEPHVVVEAHGLDEDRRVVMSGR
jgi:hypothetical protein